MTTYTRSEILDNLTRNQLLSLVNDVYPGNWNHYTKDELLKYVRTHDTSRFEHLLTSANVLKLVEKNHLNALKAKRRAKKKKEVFRRLAAPKKEAPQYDIEVEFSERDGQAFGNPLDVKSNTTYQCRMRLRQHMGEFNCIGFVLDWKPTPNLSWADGHGTRTYEEATANPLVISRLVRTGTVAPNDTAHVKVVVVERFL